MKRFLVLLVTLTVAAAGACSLNPQPFPPDTSDAAGGMPDASNKGFDSATFGDAGSFEDASADSSPIPESDGGGDAGDASEDSSNDAVADAPSDAIDDVTND